MDKNQIRTKKDDANDAKVWALSEWYGEGTHSRAPLDSTAIYPITRSHNYHHETGKRENLSRSYLCLEHVPLELDDDDLDHLKMEHLSWLYLLIEDLQIAPPYSYGRDSSSLAMSSHIHDHHEDGKLQAYDLF